MNLNIYVFGTICDKNPNATAKYTVQYIIQSILLGKECFYKYFNPWLFPPFSDKILGILDSAEKEIPKKKSLYGRFPTREGRQSFSDTFSFR